MAEAANQAVASPMSAKLDLTQACDVQAGGHGEIAYLEDSKISMSGRDQRQKVQEIENVTALPTLTESTKGVHNVSHTPSDPTVSHRVMFRMAEYGDQRGINRDIQSWSKWKKRRVLFIVCAYYFLFTFITTVTGKQTPSDRFLWNSELLSFLSSDFQ